MKLFLFIIFMFLLSRSKGYAQDDCYAEVLKNGIRAFNQKDYLQALDKFDLVLKNCLSDDASIPKEDYDRRRAEVFDWKTKTKYAIKQVMADYSKALEEAEKAKSSAQEALEEAEKAKSSTQKALEETQKALKDAKEAKEIAIKLYVEIKEKEEDFFYEHKKDIEVALKEYNIKRAKEKLHELSLSTKVSSENIRYFDKKIQNTIEDMLPKLVLVKGQTFAMGCSGKECNKDSYPKHKVMIEDFYIGESEVTQGLWKKVMGKDNILLPISKIFADEYPVRSVSWSDAQLFIKKLSEQTGKKFRLPTEAEWEYAAIGGHKANQIIKKDGEDAEFSGSNRRRLGAHAWYRTKEINKVKQKSPNQLGLFDMSGNVMEWCEDYYDPRFYAKSKGKTNPLQSSKITSNGDKVIRGGAFNSSDISFLKVTTRFHRPADTRDKGIGFRLVLEKE